MKIARYQDNAGATHVGVVDLGANIVRPASDEVDVLDVLAATPSERDALELGSSQPLDEVRLLAPVNPTSLRDFVTFEEHVEGVVRATLGEGATVPAEWFEAPTFYFTNVAAVTGPFDDVAMPPGSEVLDFELEVAAVVCREGADLSVQDASDVIGGYTILNDWSARDLQRREMRVSLGSCKGKDFANTLGPWIVTSDELAPYRRENRLELALEVSINGRPFGGDTLANMGWSFEDMVAYASRGTRVMPGDVLGSGACGSGSLAEVWGRTGRREPAPLRAGDIVEIAVEGIGTIRNRIVPGTSPNPLPRARPPKRRRPANTPATGTAR